MMMKVKIRGPEKDCKMTVMMEKKSPRNTKTYRH